MFLGRGSRNNNYYSVIRDIRAFAVFTFSKSKGKLSAFTFWLLLC